MADTAPDTGPATRSATSSTNALLPLSGGASYDSSAQKFISAVSAAGVSLSKTQKSAVNTLITRLKAYDIWNFMVAFYPLVGGTAGAHAVNAVTPGTYNIAWHGTITHDANGILGDQSTGYGNTGIVPATVFGATNNLVSMGFYSGTQDHSGNIQVDMGAIDSYNGNPGVLALGEEIDGSSGKTFMACDNGQLNNPYSEWDSTSRRTTGLLVGTKPVSGHVYMYKDGTQGLDYTSAVNPYQPTHPIYLLAWNDQGNGGSGNGQYFTKRKLSVAFIANAIPIKYMDYLYKAIQEYEVNLSRGIYADNLVCVGDSLTVGDFASAGHKYPDVLAAAYPNAVVTNLGIDGLPIMHVTGNTSLEDQASTVDTYLSKNRRNILYVWCGTNDLSLFWTQGGGVGMGSTLATRFAAYCNARRAAGWKVVVLTMIARGGQSTNPTQAQWIAEQTTFNTYVRNNWYLFADGKYDVAADSRLSDPTNTTYFQNDLTHLKDAGYAIPGNGTAAQVPPLHLDNAATRILDASSDITFSDTIQNQTASASFTIYNKGSGLLKVSGLGLPAGFTTDWTTGGTIAPFGSQVVNVTFSPTAIQSYSGAIKINSNANTILTSVINVSGNGVAAPPYDADSITFFNAVSVAGVTLNSTQKQAVDDLVTGLKSWNLWTRMTAIYPMIGGTGPAHAINLKSPGTYNVTWHDPNNKITHDSGGVCGHGQGSQTFDGSYGDTGIVPSSVFSDQQIALGFYSVTQQANSANGNAYMVDMGALSGYSQCLILSEEAGNGFGKIFWCLDNSQGPYASDAGHNTLGLLVGSRVLNDWYEYKNGSQLVDWTHSGATSLPTCSIFLMAWNDGAGNPTYGSARKLAFAFVGTQIGPTLQAHFYDVVQAYQTALGRNV